MPRCGSKDTWDRRKRLPRAVFAASRNFEVLYNSTRQRLFKTTYLVDRRLSIVLNMVRLIQIVRACFTQALHAIFERFKYICTGENPVFLGRFHSQCTCTIGINQSKCKCLLWGYFSFVIVQHFLSVCSLQRMTKS